MDNKVKIAIGCVVAAVLSGLLVVIVAGVVLYYMKASPGSTTNRNYNSNSNRNSRSESSSNSNTNSNDNKDANDNESSSNSSSSSSLSDDQRHRLLYAASVTGDAEIIQRVSKKIGILKDDHTPTENNIEFMTQHVGWMLRNSDFVQTVNTPEKARTYVDQHIND